MGIRDRNQYTAAMVTTEGALKVILRETFKHPSMIDKVSFPAGRSTEVRAYTRKGILRRDDDEDYAEYGDDEVVEEESDDGWSESDGELDSGTPDIDVDRDDEAVSYTHLRAHETPEHLVCRLLLEKKNQTNTYVLCALQLNNTAHSMQPTYY